MSRTRTIAVALRGAASLAGTAAVALALTADRGRAQGAVPEAAAVCVSCHPAGAAGEAPNFATLAGLSESYLVKQLEDYRAGRRKGDIMAPMAANLKSGDLRLVASHFASQPPAPGTVADPALAARGKPIYEDGNPATGVPNCVGCHGPNGGDSPAYPPLAGQVASYTAQEMLAFKTGTRTNDRARVMREIASRMTEDEIKAVAEYAAGLRR